jgi:hypothetical protein
LRVAGNPVELMDTIMLTLTDDVDVLFDVSILARKIAISAIWMLALLSIMWMVGMDGRC